MKMCPAFIKALACTVMLVIVCATSRGEEEVSAFSAVIWSLPQVLADLEDGTQVAVLYPLRMKSSSDAPFEKVFGNMISGGRIVHVLKDGKTEDLLLLMHVAIDGPIPVFKDGKWWTKSKDGKSIVFAQWSGILRILDLNDMTVTKIERYQAGISAKSLGIDLGHWYFLSNIYSPEKKPTDVIGPMWIKNYGDGVTVVHRADGSEEEIDDREKNKTPNQPLPSSATGNE